MKTPVRSLACAFVALCAFRLSAANIGTAAEFVTVMTGDPSGSHTLTADIDLTGSGYATVASFSGTLDGAGHTLSGIGAQPLFTACTGTLKNLAVDGSGATIRGTKTALICTESRGATFQDVSIGNVTVYVNAGNGFAGIGLFVGMAYDGTSFVRCTTEATATVSGNNFANDNVGGFVGMAVNDTTLTGNVVTFTDCTNRAVTVAYSSDNNGGQGHGGFVGKCLLKTSAASDRPEVVFTRCVNAADIEIKTKGPVGGFVGRHAFSGNGEAHVVFMDCVNLGNIENTGKTSTIYAGGFVGAVGQDAVVLAYGSVNRGNVDVGDYGKAGGFVGYFRGYFGTHVSATLLNCANYGSIAGLKSGGLVGYADCNVNRNCGAIFRNCANYGAAGGEMLGECTSMKNVTTIDNVFTRTTALWQSLDGNCTVPSVVNAVSAEDDGYSATVACKTLASRAKDLGWNEWWKVGRASGMPELIIWSGDVWKIWTVRYLEDDGETVLHEQQVEDGMAAPPVQEPSREGYVFDGWKPALPATITADFETLASYRQAGTGEIGSAADFVRALSANPAGTFTIMNDIDLTGAGYATIAEFSGTLDGGGKTISGLGGTQLFTTLSGTVRNLTVDGRVKGVATTVKIAQNAAWAVLATTACAATVEDVVIEGYDVTYEVGRPSGAGIFFAVATTTAEKGCVFTRCRAGRTCSVRMSTNVNIGGIASRVNRDTAFYGDCAVFTACTNAATFTTQGSGNSSQGVGGICGLISANATEKDGTLPGVRFFGCVNEGPLSLTGLYDSFGGIVGQVCGASSPNNKHPYMGTVVSIDGCANFGAIENTVAASSKFTGHTFYAGGILGSVTGKGAALVSNCVNRANVTFANDYAATNVCCGGIIGYVDTAGLPTEIVNSANYGDVRAHLVGGLTASVGSNSGWNRGNVRWLNSANYGALLKISETREFARAGQVVGKIVSGKGSDNHFVANNCFGQDSVKCAEYAVFSETNCRSAKDADYEPHRMAKKLNSVARANGWTEWKTGRLEDDTRAPELLPFCTKPYMPGFLIIISGMPSDVDGRLHRAI